MKISSSIPTIHKEAASADIDQKTATWETWHCDSDEFQHRYVPGATFYVVQGCAKLTFSHGAELIIESGDLVSISEGAEAKWAISVPIETRYIYHDNVDATTRA